MRSRQIAERLGVEEAHMLEFQQFNMVWDKRMADYEHHAEDMVFAMRVRRGKDKWTTNIRNEEDSGCKHFEQPPATFCIETTSLGLK